MGLPDVVQRDIDLARSALVFVDMQRRHLDMDIGYHTLRPDDAERVVRRGTRALEAARAHDLKVAHVVTWIRRRAPWGPGDGRNPFWGYQDGAPIPGTDGLVRQAGKCTAESPYAEVMPDVAPLAYEPQVLKKRYSGFYNTDLDNVLRGFGVETLFIGGVNTNNCVLGTVFDAHARDYRVIVLADACGSMNGPEYHEAALRQIEAALGFVMNVEAFVALLEDKAPASV